MLLLYWQKRNRNNNKNSRRSSKDFVYNLRESKKGSENKKNRKND
jgi:hypothetical protein